MLACLFFLMRGIFQTANEFFIEITLVNTNFHSRLHGKLLSLYRLHIIITVIYF